MGYPYHKNHKIMSYNREQHEKNEKLIEKELAGCNHQDISDVKQSVHQAWASDNEAMNIIKAKKEEIALRATPQEVDEVFRDLRV